MGTIKTTKDIAKDLTCNVAEGLITLADCLNWFETYYSGAVTQMVLWDFTKADMTEITSEEYIKIAEALKIKSHSRAGGKTAYLAIGDLDYGLGRMFQALTEFEGLEFECRAFRKMTEAKKWLGV